MASSKRRRENGQVSREEYEYETSLCTTNDIGITRASPLTISNRRQLKSKKNCNTQRKEYYGQVRSLNIGFVDYVRGEVAQDPSACLATGAQDYLNYITSLESRYMREQGLVLTFGSGDCGQLAHGTDLDEDLMVKFPRGQFQCANNTTTHTFFLHMFLFVQLSTL